MTETSPITTANFIGGTIAAITGLIILQQIVVGTAGSIGSVEDDFSTFANNINKTCQGPQTAGTVNLSENFEVSINSDNVDLRRDGSSEIKRKTGCDVKSASQTMSSGSAYDYSISKSDDKVEIELTEK